MHVGFVWLLFCTGEVLAGWGWSGWLRGSENGATAKALAQENAPPSETAPFLRALLAFTDENDGWNVSVYEDETGVPKTHTLADIRGKKGFLKCDYILYHTLQKSGFDDPDNQLFIRHQAEWNQQVKDRQCLIVMHRASTKYLRSESYYDRYPAGIILIGLIKSGVIVPDQNKEPWILYTDLDFYFGNTNAGVRSIVDRLYRGARPETPTVEMNFCNETKAFPCDAPPTAAADDIDYVITNDVACDLRLSWRRHRLNSGAQLFRPRPMSAFMLDATQRAYLEDVGHPYPSNDQGFLTWVVQTAFSFNFDRLNSMCREMAEESFWSPSCQGDSLLISRHLNEEGIDSAPFLQEAAAIWLQPDAAHFSTPDAQTSLEVSRSALSGKRNPRALAIVCIRWMQSTGCEIEDYWAKYRGSLVQNLFGWRCDDFAAHFMGCTRTKSEVFLRKRWRQNIVDNPKCRASTPLKTNNDGSPFDWELFTQGQ